MNGSDLSSLSRYTNGGQQRRRKYRHLLRRSKRYPPPMASGPDLLTQSPATRESVRTFRPHPISPSVTSVRCFPLWVVLAGGTKVFAAEPSPTPKLSLRGLYPYDVAALKAA
jgi:hypothetical protein